MGNDVHAGGLAQGREDLPDAGAAGEVEVDAVDGARVELDGIDRISLGLHGLQVFQGVRLGPVLGGFLLQLEEPVLGDLIVRIQDQGLAHFRQDSVREAPGFGLAGQGEVQLGCSLGGPLDADAGLRVGGIAPEGVAVFHDGVVVAALVEGLVGPVQGTAEG